MAVDIYNDDRVVLTFDAGGTNFVFSAIQGGSEVLEPITFPSHADHLERCLETIKKGFDHMLSNLSQPAVAISFAFPALLAVDFFVRAFTKLKYSPLSWLSHLFVNSIGTNPVWIDKAPKVFAARIGLLLTLITAVSALVGFPVVAMVAGVTLVGFAFIECGLNFCAGCWVYTYVVYPLVRKK